MAKSLGSDNHSGIHPQLLQALIDANDSHAHSYGGDSWTQQADQAFQKEFGVNARTFFVFNGSAANVLSLKAFLKSFESVACSAQAHLTEDECGAPESVAGNKLHLIPTETGKIKPSQLEPLLSRRGDQHCVQLKMVSITQPTEVGTVYSLEELKELREWTRKNNMYLHVDGARLIHAAHYLRTDLRTAAGDADVISFGGTKNGLLFGEAVIAFDPHIARDLKYFRKQLLQLPSKMRFLSAQFATLLSGEPPLWKQIAQHAHEKAQELAEGLRSIPEFKITHEVQANSVFATFPKAWTKELKKSSFFYIWNESLWQARLMMSFDTSSEEIQAFLQTIQRLQKETPNG